MGCCCSYIDAFNGLGISNSVKLPPFFAVGLILVACCPGGTASNVIAYLAKANVALSVAMTTCSTFGAILLTPLLTATLSGSYLEVDAWGLFFSTLKVVLFPVTLGVLLNQYASRLTKKMLPLPTSRRHFNRAYCGEYHWPRERYYFVLGLKFDCSHYDLAPFRVCFGLWN